MFDLYSTCATCGETMAVTERDQRTHPMCDGAPDHVAELAAQYVAAVEADDQALADQLEHALDLTDRRAYSLSAAALLYASWGWPVFPLGIRSKYPLPSCRECKPPPRSGQEKCPGPEACGHELCHGLKDAVTDPAVITDWWTRYPDANVGLATGHLFDVLDVDAPSGTLEWATLRESNAYNGAHGIVMTPSSGLHVYLRPSGGGNLAGFRPGLDYRGIGGYVVAPPSLRDNGLRYQWTSRPSPDIRAAASATGKAA